MDIDILRDDNDIKNLYETLGGSWSNISSMVGVVQKQIQQNKPPLSAEDICNEIKKILMDVSSTDEFPFDKKNEINRSFRKASPWDVVKEAGEAGLPKGQATENFMKVSEQCKCVGLWIVPVGELEGFCKSIGGHGPAWVQKVIDKFDLAKCKELSKARDFVQEIWSFSVS